MCQSCIKAVIIVLRSDKILEHIIDDEQYDDLDNMITN